MADLIKTEQSLNSEKLSIDSKIAVLQTKAGADAFIAKKIADIEPMIPRLSQSMRWQCAKVVNKLKTEPAQCVSEEIAKMCQVSAQLGETLAAKEELK